MPKLPQLLTCLLFLLPVEGIGQSLNVRLHSDLPVLDNNGKLYAGVYYQADSAMSVTIDYRCYKFNTAVDSILICRYSTDALRLQKGVHERALFFTGSQSDIYAHPAYLKILNKAGTIPPGNYKVFITLATAGHSTEKILAHQVDSNLTATSPLRKELNQTLVPERKAKVLGISFAKEAKAVNSLASNTAKTVDRAAGKVDRLFKSKGLTSVTTKRDGKELINLYCDDWFVGRYEVNLDQSLNTQVKKQQDALTQPVTSLATNELEGYKSLLSQVRELTKLKKEERELSGELELTGNWANAQPEYSQQDNNFYEVRGRVETTVQDIPISIEGYYTTQDKNRQIKASYIRVHYDADKAKDGLMNLVGGFKNQFSQTLSKGKGLEQVYGSYLENLKGEKNVLLNDLEKETGVSDINTTSLDTTGLQQQIVASLRQKMTDTVVVADSNNSDSLTKAQRTQRAALRTADSANKIYQKALKRYERLVALEQTGRKYYALVEQYRNTNYVDSAFGYDKLKNLDKADAMTYKQLAKSAAGLLPEGKVKKFVTGLTNLDLGIFPKDLSKYTMAGQQLKGIDVGYDLGFCQVGATYGKTEFAGRDGTLDKYAAYSGRVLFQPAKQQKVTLVYYGYSPSTSAMAKDTFFKDMDIATPTFKQPVHIVSAAYEGTIAKNVRVDGEIATSFRSGTATKIKDQLSSENLAWHINAEGMIPKTGIHIETGYEHGGESFQNSTLPVNLSGTDLFKIAGKGDLFKSFLTLGIEYNHIQQQSFSATGNNSKWGFEIATHSKQYPSVSLSYKPYTTFRSYTDTLAVPQRPLVGAVWTGRATYQFKKTGGRCWRFSAVYNKSSSEIDTTAYGSNLVQANIIYSTKTWMAMGSVGNMDQSTNGAPIADAPAHTRTTFGMVSGSYPVTKSSVLNGGIDMGVAGFGMSKYGVNAGISYRMKKLPLTTRVVGRYSSYRLTEAMGWKPVYSGSVDLLWQFKMKINK